MPGGGMRQGAVPGFVGGLFALVGVIFLGVALASWSEGRRFAADGVTITGTVEKRWESERDCRDESSNTTRTCTDFNLGYSYVVDGKTYNASGTTGYDQWAALTEGSAIMLRYLPSDPSQVVTSFRADAVSASGDMGIVALIFGGLGGLFTLLGGGLVGWLVVQARAGAWMRQNGARRGAVVLAQEETNFTVNDRRMWRITWRDDLGATGQSRGRRREELPAAGERIAVLVDPSGKRPALWEGDL